MGARLRRRGHGPSGRVDDGGSHWHHPQGKRGRTDVVAADLRPTHVDLSMGAISAGLGADAGGGSGVRPTRDPFSHVHSNSMRPWIDKGAEPCSCVFFELEVL